MSRPVPSLFGQSSFGESAFGPRCFRAELDPSGRTGDMGTVRDAMKTWLSAQRVDDHVAMEILVAAGEACANVLEHSGACRTADSPAGWIEAKLDGRHVRVTVVDHGRWIERDPTYLQRRNRGRGRMLMSGLMDDCAIATGSSGTTVTLRKALPPGSR